MPFQKGFFQTPFYLFFVTENNSENFTPRRYQWQKDVQAELNEEDQIVDEVAIDSIMGQFLKAVHNRLQAETTSTPERLPDGKIVGDKWLLRSLKESNWWLRATSAKSICLKLGLNFSEESYYRDIRIWLPDEEFGVKPPCVECGESDKVSSHAMDLEIVTSDGASQA